MLLADTVRAALLTLSLGAVLASSLLWVSALRLGGTASLLAVWVVATAQIVLLAEILSLARALDWPGFLLGHVLVLGGAAIWARRRPRDLRWQALTRILVGLAHSARVACDWRTPALPILAGASLLTGLVSTVLALWVPPNSQDALAYHMSRVGYALQFRSLAAYPSDDLRQVVFPMNAELLILWTVAFLRSDQLANAVQLVAWPVAAVSVYGLGRQVGFGRGPSLFGAGSFALLPQAVLQSTNCLNDLVVTGFLATSLYFLLQIPGGPRGDGQRATGEEAGPLPFRRAPLILAGAAAGLALGTKGTALLALPGLMIAFLLVCGRLASRREAPGSGDRVVQFGASLLAACLAAVLLGSAIYLQNWYFFGSPVGPRSTLAGGPGPMSWEGFVSNLARALFTFAFADLSGFLADRHAWQLAGPLVGALATIGEWLFAVLRIPTVVPELDEATWPGFTFDPMPRVDEVRSGVGLVGARVLLGAAATLVWWGSAASGGRVLALASLSFVVCMAVALPWNPFGGGRFFLIACALAAPLVGPLVGDRERRANDGDRPSSYLRRSSLVGPGALALVVALWSAATGLYSATFNNHKPLRALLDHDRDGWLFFWEGGVRPLFRELDQEIGPATSVGVYGDIGRRPGLKIQYEYLFFQPRFERTVVPLVAPGYARRWEMRRPPPWSNEAVLAAYQPRYIVVQSRRPATEALPEIVPGQCFEIALRYGKPSAPWELWRCDDGDPRSLVANGDFSAWSGSSDADRSSAWPDDPTPTPVSHELPVGWIAESGGGRVLVSRRAPGEPPSEPFRVRLDHRAALGVPGHGGLAQTVAVGDRLRGSLLVVDARVRADREGAAALRVDDGIGVSEAVSRSTEAETLRVEHRIAAAATGLQVILDASRSGQDAVVLVRSILAIPR